MDGPNIRERTERIEHQILSPYAAFADQSRGRAREEEPCEMRTAYQRDRDRVIHCNAFRRLKLKTQVFLSPEGDHYRTRLTHTLEVAQIARTIARGLRLNEDLTEAIALAHDLGHTPFGHAGERALNAVHPQGFEHFKQSLRVVDKLEKDGCGLNLTWEVRNGIVCHTRGKEADTLEGRIVRYADKIAYINHDIDDSIRAGVMCEADIPAALREQLGKSKSARINTLVVSLIENSGEQIRMAEADNQAFEELHLFMYEKVYLNPECKHEEGKAEQLVQMLYDHFCRHPDRLPSPYDRIRDEEGAPRAACDYIAGMSDFYAMRIFRKLYIPEVWEGGGQ